jgi:hypothetical protein
MATQPAAEISVPGDVWPIQSRLGARWVWSTRALLRERLGEPDERLREEGRSGEWWSYQAKGVWFRVRIDPDSEKPVLPEGGLVDAVRLTTASAGSVAGVKVGDTRERAASLLGPALPGAAGTEADGRSQRFLGGGLELRFTQGDEVAWIQLYAPTLDLEAAPAAPAGPSHRVWMPPIAAFAGARLEPEVQASVLEALTEHFGAIRSGLPFVQDTEEGASHALELTLLEVNWAEAQVVHSFLQERQHHAERFRCPAVMVTTRLGWRLRPIGERAPEWAPTEGTLLLRTFNSPRHRPGQVCGKLDPTRAVVFGAVPRLDRGAGLDVWSGEGAMLAALHAFVPAHRVVAIDRERGLVGINAQSMSYAAGSTFAITLNGVNLQDARPGTPVRHAIVLGGSPRVEHLVARSTADGVLWCEVHLSGSFAGIGDIFAGRPGRTEARRQRLLDRLPDPGSGLLTASLIEPSFWQGLGGAALSVHLGGLEQRFDAGTFDAGPAPARPTRR